MAAVTHTKTTTTTTVTWRTTDPLRSGHTWGTGKAAVAYRKWDGGGRVGPLNVSHCKLRSLPRELMSLTELRVLRCVGNMITEIPDWLLNMKELRALWFTSNLIEHLPRNIAHLEHLEHLYLSSNRLTSLPDGIVDMTRLMSLHLAGNRLTSLPEGMDAMTSLDIINVCGNKLTSIPSCIFDMGLSVYVDARTPPPPLEDAGAPTTAATIKGVPSEVIDTPQ